MKTKRTILLPSHLWLIAVVSVMAGLAVFSLTLAQAKEKQAGEPNKMAMMEEKKETATEEKHEEKMNMCTMKCVKNCQEGMDDITAADATIKVALDAIEKGDLSAARSELAKAQKILAKVHERMRENIEKMPCANIKCPMTGNPINRMEMPMEQTRMCKGMKIGFCSPGCPAAWDKLTDDEKDTKLKESMPPKE